MVATQAAATLLWCLMTGDPANAGAPTPKTEVAPKPAAPKAATSGLGSIGLPHYQAPPAYSVDLVIKSPKADMVMKRFIDQGRIRTEMTHEGMDVVMIEMGDEKGTSLILMPKEKRAIKQSREGMMAMAGEMSKTKLEEAAKESPEPDAKVDDLGEETIDGKVVRKLRFTMPEGSSIGWFDKATGAPVRMEAAADGETAVIEWKDYQVGPQGEKLFETPKGYDVMDMDEMMSRMKDMGGVGGMKGLMGGVGGAGGMSGMMAGMGGMGGLNGMAGSMGQNFGQNMGGGLGASLGGALGGPLGAVAGRYLGGRIGGMIGRKTAQAVTPGK